MELWGNVLPIYQYIPPTKVPFNINMIDHTFCCFRPTFLVAWMCKFSPLLSRTPVAASTLSLALLSLDRYNFIKLEIR